MEEHKAFDGQAKRSSSDLEMHNMTEGEAGGTNYDEHEMAMLGRKQQLNRNFRFISTLGFACTLMSTWEIGLTTTTFSLLNGGYAGLIWGYLIVWAGYMLVFASIAEMASIAPTSGGQYHWVSEFAPPGSQKFISYTVGWISCLGWQVGLASLCFLVGSMIQGLILINNPDYIPQPWHATLLVIAIAAFCIIFNTFLAQRLPMVEGLVLIVHVLGFFGVLIPLWVLGTRNDAPDVFTFFFNGGMWDTAGISFMVGLLGPVYTLIGADSAVHMSEEIKDASSTLPKAIMWAATINGTMGWIMMITFAFTAGDLFALLAEYPVFGPSLLFIYGLLNGTGFSNAGTSVIVAILVVNITSACISTVATASRQTWAFARDGGVPFSRTLAHVKPGWNIPLNSVILTFVITALLSLINLGSTVAFQNIGSLAISAILGTYIISFTCLVFRRLRGPLPVRRWSLGPAGIFVNIGAICFLIVVWVFAFFPTNPLPTVDAMNYNVVMFGGVMILAMVYYIIYGRKQYTAPVQLVKRTE